LRHSPLLGCMSIVAVAMFSAFAVRAGAQDAAPAAKPDREAKAATAPARTADGHPNLSGVYGGGGELDPTNPDYLKTNAIGFAPSIVASRGGTFTNYERDKVFTRRMNPNKPYYKPQYWETVKNLDRNNNDNDPTIMCMPAGVPRMGAPNMIVQTPTLMVFMYSQGAGANGSPAATRLIAMDGRAHTPIEDLDGTWYGESIGRWEGDTLVIDTIGFNSSSWLDEAGFFHSENMHVVEKMTRTGNTLTWQATVEDPDVLMEPWVMEPRTMRANPNPNALLPESSPCADRDHAHIFTKERS
jgi:hypothetical protein